jgi:solute carrier family 25 uncoupling protein 27
MVRHVPYSGTRIVAYEALRSRLGGSAHEASVATKMFMGATAGALGQLIAVPADVLKVRMQAAGAGTAAAPAALRAGGGMASAAAAVWRTEGAAGFWRGGLPAVQRAGLVNLGELATYDAAKRWASAHAPEGLAAACGCAHAADAPPVHVFSALASGFVACAASTPADVVKTRLMAQRHAAGPPRYSGALDCLRQSVAAEGLGVLYRGFLPTWARLGPWQMTFWLSYEFLRRRCGLDGF